MKNYIPNNRCASNEEMSSLLVIPLVEKVASYVKDMQEVADGADCLAFSLRADVVIVLTA